MIGYIARKQTKRFFGSGYYEVKFNHKIYTIYPVGLGREGIKIPVFDQQEKQVSLIEKGIMVIDNMDVYEITAIDSLSSEISLLFSLYYDMTQYGHYGVYATKSKEIQLEYTFSKKRKSKYKPQFKEYVQQNYKL